MKISCNSGIKSVNLCIDTNNTQTAMKKIVVSTGAGMSAESGLSTFRDAGGLWDKYPVMEGALKVLPEIRH